MRKSLEEVKKNILTELDSFLVRYPKLKGRGFPHALRSLYGVFLDSNICDEGSEVRVKLGRRDILERLGHGSLESSIEKAVTNFYTKYIDRKDMGSLNESLFFSSEVRRIRDCIENTSSLKTVTKHRNRFLRSLRSAVKKHQPLPALTVSNQRLLDMASSRTKLIVDRHSKQKLRTMRNWFGFESLGDTLSFIILSSEREVDESKIGVVMFDIKHLLSMIQMETPVEEILEEMVWMRTSYTKDDFLNRKSKVYKYGERRSSKLNICAATYHNLFGDISINALILDRLDLYKDTGFKSSKLKPGKLPNTIELEDELEPIYDRLLISVSEEQKARLINVFVNFLNRNISLYRGTNEFHRNEIHFQTSGVRSVMLPEETSKRIDEFRANYGIKYFNVAVHLIIDPERKFW